jgi:Uma2 family endonuclease
MAYQPDALVRCGEPLSDNAIQTFDPLVVVELLSLSTGARDPASKLEDYFRLTSIRQYLIIKTENRAVIRHCLGADAAIATRILRDGVLDLAPPGISVEIATFFPCTGEPPPGGRTGPTRRHAGALSRLGSAFGQNRSGCRAWPISHSFALQ